MNNKFGKILVIYFHNLGFPIRKTNQQMINCFERYSDKQVYLLNLAFPCPRNLFKVEFDLIVYHDLLLCKRSLPRRFEFIRKRAQPLKKLSGYRIATVQDEFTQTKLLNQFLLEFDIQHIFSVAPPSEWAKIYPLIDRNRIKIDHCLTGYLDDDMLSLIDELAKDNIRRDIDIGYRAAYARPALGFIGNLKSKITEVFLENTNSSNLKVDLSNDPKDTILGENWYRFLLRCKYTLGVESGASVLDEDGSIEQSVEKYLELNPKADFEEISRMCLGEKDGKLKLQVVGPRHLEACATRTCQVLVEGEYNGILKPEVHYIPIKKDFSNVKDVIKIIEEDSKREAIIANAYNDIVLSDKYSFQKYVTFILNRSLGENYQWSSISDLDLKVYKSILRQENLIWKYVRIRSYIVRILLSLLPQKGFKLIERYMKNTSKPKLALSS